MVERVAFARNEPAVRAAELLRDHREIACRGPLALLPILRLSLRSPKAAGKTKFRCPKVGNVFRL